MQKMVYVGQLKVVRCDTRKEMGEVAGLEAAAYIRELAKSQNEINIIFAAAPSQNEFLETLRQQLDLPWDKVNAFQMDDYVGIDSDAPARFANSLDRSIFRYIPLRSCEMLHCAGEADAEKEMIRYGALLKNHPLDIAFIGIGENGHIAFNDPGIADFFDHEEIKRIAMAEASRQQQVNDGCFPSLSAVPYEALTVTVPVILRARRVFCIVPGASKAAAIRETLCEPVSVGCPASALRLHKNATLYLDADSAEQTEL